MASLKLTVDMSQVVTHLSDVEQLAKPRIRDALNRAIIRARVVGIAEIRKVVNVKVAAVHSRIRLRKAVGNNLSAKLSMNYKKHPNLASFGFSIVKPSKGVKPRPGGGLKSRAWKNKGPRQRSNSSGAILHRGVFVWNRSAKAKVAMSRQKGVAKVVPTKGSYAGRLLKAGPRKGQPIKRQPLKPIFGPAIKAEFESAFPRMEEEGRIMFNRRIRNTIMHNRS